ncbi:FtsK/SpoIIIE domain-containing protein [Paenibacillus sp.]|uniref:FtsK/SpoIIIE domain-containing protein n=1 Tax=Paenibacillus sp. TaxID=58172 RepID=UPI00281108A7|nr:FtsK/SpoIIIE domain-containing protein [Paenibacillus sp.]
MLLETIGCAAAAGLLAYTAIDKSGSASDAAKIQRVAASCGLTVSEGGKLRTIHLLRRTRHAWGTEYAYRIPIGLSFDDIVKKRQHIEDGLNHKRGLIDLTIDDLRTLRIGPDILQQLRALLTGPKQRKEVLLDYDGTLRIRIYRDPMPTLVPFDEAALASCRDWRVLIGESREGRVYHDFDAYPRMVAAGMTRYGKSVFLKGVVTTLVAWQPTAVRLTLLDLKGGLAFNRFANLRQVATLATDVTEGLAALRSIAGDMKERKEYLRSRGFEDVVEAGIKYRHFVIVDEGAELASAGETNQELKKAKIECENILAEIARIGGGLGYRLIFATQYPTGDTLPRQVKQNCDARICFRLPTETASRVVLDEAGAEQLPLIKGRAIYRTDRKHVIQTPYIGNDFIEKTIRPHLVIRPRKEEAANAPAATEARAGRSYTLVIEEA